MVGGKERGESSNFEFEVPAPFLRERQIRSSGARGGAVESCNIARERKTEF